METTTSTDVLDANIRGHSDPRSYRIAGRARSPGRRCAADKARPDMAKPRDIHSRKLRITFSFADEARGLPTPAYPTRLL